MTTWGALRWAETGVADAPDSDRDDRRPDRSLDMYHEHARALSQWSQADAKVRRADDLLDAVDPATGAVVVEDERLTAEFLRGHRAERDRERAEMAATLRGLRERMRSAHPDLALPRLPFALRHLDDEGQS